MRSLFLSFLISVLALLSNTIGFDFYHHAISASSFETIFRYNPPWIILDYEVSRYLLLHFYLVVFGFGFLPVSLFFIFGNSIVIQGLRLATDRNQSASLEIGLALFLIYQFVFLSATGFSVCFIVLSVFYFRALRYRASVVTLYFSMSVSPVGFILGFFIGFFYYKKRFLTIFASLLILTSSIIFQGFLSSNYGEYQGRTVDFDSLQKIVTKLPEIFAFSFIAVFSHFFLRYRFVFFHLGNLTRFGFRSFHGISLLHGVSLVLVVAIFIMSLRPQLASSGPVAVLLRNDRAFNTSEKYLDNIVKGAWVSPMLFDENVLYNQYRFRR